METGTAFHPLLYRQQDIIDIKYTVGLLKRLPQNRGVTKSKGCTCYVPDFTRRCQAVVDWRDGIRLNAQRLTPHITGTMTDMLI